MPLRNHATPPAGSTARLQPFRGCVALVGPEVDEIAAAALPFVPPSVELGAAWHVTLFTKAELRADSALSSLPWPPSPGALHPLGVKGCQRAGVFFVPCLWPEGQRLRLRAKLPVKDFHVTLTRADDHALDKGPDGVLPGTFAAPRPLTVLDSLAHHFFLQSSHQRSAEVALEICATDPGALQGWLRLGDAALALQQHKLAMLAYAATLAAAPAASERLREHCLKRLYACADHTEWGALFSRPELSQVPDQLLPTLTKPWGADLRRLVLEGAPPAWTPSFSLESRHRLLAPPVGGQGPPYELPRFFRWVVPFRLAGMSTPRGVDDLRTLASPQMGIRHIVTLTAESPLPRDWLRACPHLQHTHMPVPNYCAPSPEQIEQFMALATSPGATPLLVHCGAGKGRAGTMLACYLVAHGFAPPSFDWTHPTLPAAQAIALLREIRPGSIETERQQQAVFDYERLLWKRRCVAEEDIPEPPPSAPVITGDARLDHADLILLCGLPGSGKTWFRQALMNRDPSWVALSGDEDGRATCEASIGLKRDGRKLILDRCNGKPDDRKHFLALASTWATHPVAVHFAYAVDLCTRRAQSRPSHPTLPPGPRVRAAIRQHAREATTPVVGEGFRAVVSVTSFAASWALVQRLAAPPPLFKFPRTCHLVDLGAASRDDLHASLPAPRDGARVVITEKVDGANMGFSLSASGDIVVQNRSHYVTPDSHEQFKRLGAFVAAHREQLYALLFRDATFPERWVLFGEWLAAKHSIHYQRLPQLFLAFDLYDRLEDAFVDRASLEAALDGTGIDLVPVVLTQDTLPTPQQLRELVHTQSRFYDGPVEGVYVKLELNGRVCERGKVVRGDFIAGNEHWSRGNIQTNVVLPATGYLDSLQ